MAEQFDLEKFEDFKQLLVAHMIHLDAVTRLLVEKGLITKEEFYEKLKEVQYEYHTKGIFKG